MRSRGRDGAAALMVLVSVVAVGSLVGCRSDGGVPVDAASSSGPAAPSVLPAGMGSGAADGVFPRAVGHFAGSTDLESAPTRVAAVSTGQLDGLLTLCVVPVGATTARGAGLVPEYLTRAFGADAALQQGLRGLRGLGSRTDPDVEAVAAAEPDLILTNSTVDEGVRAQFARIAPVVVTEGTGANWKQDFLLVADAVGKRQAAEGLLSAYQADAAAFGQSVTAQQTVSLTSVAPDRVRIFGVNSFAGSVVADTGLARPATQTFTETSADVSLETLDRAAGNWIFFGVQGKGNGLTSSAVWRRLPAVQSGQARQVDYDTWYLNAGPTAARTVLGDLTRALRD